jgi:outer membrane protein OmpA-like peptidoglycan-associated protein
MVGVESIDWLFLTNPVDVSRRTEVKGIPDIVFELDQVNHRDFVSLTKEYIARGDERYLLVGKVKNKQEAELIHLRDSLYLLRAEHEYQLNRLKKERINIKSMDILRESNKKAIRLMGKFMKRLDKEFAPRFDSIHNTFNPPIDSLYELIHYLQYTDVRFYFDNFFLVKGKEPIVKSDSIYEMPFELNTTYRFNQVVFDTDKDILKPESYEELNNLAELLNKFKVYQVVITGHTDSINSDGYNQQLSERRAAACVYYLIGKGIEADRLYSEGKGESEPIASNQTSEGRALNRRVEFRLIKDK